MKTAEIVSVGTEHLLGQIVDTHAPYLARVLANCGVACLRRSTIGDNYDRLVAQLQDSLARCDVLITIGGLGPTMDDLTRDAIAEALGDTLVREHAYESELRAWFESKNYPFAETNAKQADRPNSGKMIPNPNGTAPGLLCEKNGKIVIAMPGPKGEFQPMADGFVKDYLESLGAGVIHSRTLRVIGMGESIVEERVSSLMASSNPTIAPYAHVGEVHLRITASARNREEADALIDPVETQVRELLGNHVYGTDDVSLEAAVVETLVRNGKTFSVAESMTGGLFCAGIAAVPGASRAFRGGFVTYSAGMKVDVLGVPEDVVAKYGPVSPEVAANMAQGARQRANSDFAVSITGNAGPTSDVDGKPIGLVFTAVDDGNHVHVSEHRLRGTREDIQRRATRLALQELRSLIIEK
jgi:nicotinamide-nucleotide amidase